MIRLSLCFIIMCSTLSVGHSAKLIGKIESVRGEAFIAHLLKKKKVAVVGEKVFEKDKVKTGADGEVVIALADSKLTIGPDAYTKISSETQNASSTKLALYGGKVGFKVNKLNAEKSFTVRTPSAVAGVRGTEGEMSFDSDSGVTGTTSIPHSAEGDDPSIVYTSTPEHEDAMKDAIRASRENEANGQGEPDPNENVTILPEGTGSVHLPDGEVLVMENENGLAADDLGNKGARDSKKDKARSAFGLRTAVAAENWDLYLDNLIDRLDQVEDAVGNKNLPGAPATPSNDD